MPRPYRFFGEGILVPLENMKNLPLLGKPLPYFPLNLEARRGNVYRMDALSAAVSVMLSEASSASYHPRFGVKALAA